MNKRETKLLHRIEKAGIRRSLKEGHLVSESELLDTKIQILPTYFRAILSISGLISGITSYLLFASDHAGWGFVLAFISILLFLFAALGIRRTFSAILDSLDATASTELLGTAIEEIGSALGSIFDGV